MVMLNMGDIRVKVLEAKPTTLRQAINVATEYLAILDPTGQAGSAVGLDTRPSLVVGERPCLAPMRPETDLPCSSANSSGECQNDENSQASESLRLALQRLTELLAKMESNDAVSPHRPKLNGAGQNRKGDMKFHPLQHPGMPAGSGCDRK
jgi:hypothetical protein